MVLEKHKPTPLTFLRMSSLDYQWFRMERTAFKAHVSPWPEKRRERPKQSPRSCFITRISPNLTAELPSSHTPTGYHFVSVDKMFLDPVCLDPAIAFLARKQFKVRKLKEIVEAEPGRSVCWSGVPEMEPKFDINTSTRKSFKAWGKREGGD